MASADTALSAPIGRAEPWAAIIVGAGFAGIGMAIALKRSGIDDFVVVEKSDNVGGVWRDNVYPGAACDVPSHLYSYSFELNPEWSSVFASQPEILAYIQTCAVKYGILPHTRLGLEVVQATFDEDRDLWDVRLSDGTNLTAKMVISAVGQLSRPALPKIAGLDRPTIPAFHSARWRSDVELEGKRIAVIGTGASAIQFVPAIADTVKSLTIFQRSAAHVIPRPDRQYSEAEKQRFQRSHFHMRLHRLWFYLKYEMRALAFTRFKGLLDYQAGSAFRKQLAEQVADPTLRKRLEPDYPVGCKRLLLSDDYLATMARPHVSVVTGAIKTLTEAGVQTEDGERHEFDAIIYGTGFAATDFLVPMQIIGRDGIELGAEWRKGAAAYLGMSVPGFPNFFMLYGPNTNLGHNSIIYMIESQIDHILRCWAEIGRQGATSVEVSRREHARADQLTQRKLARTVWAGCTSWYTDDSGRNTTNWPGFTFSYRWQVRHRSLSAYRFVTRDAKGTALVHPPVGGAEGVSSFVLRLLLRGTFKVFAGPPAGVRVQRAMTAILSASMPAVRDVERIRTNVGTVPVEIVSRGSNKDSAILYLHGGAFCLGDAYSHRAVTSRLAAAAELPVWVPEYRLAPEHPYPAALDDALACWRAMLASGLTADQIVVAGDSAGGGLALALAQRLREAGEQGPAGLALLSPFVDPTLTGDSLTTKAATDPMIRRSWLSQALRWYADPSPGVLERSLAWLPPVLVQVGEDEGLLSDSTRLVEQAKRDGGDCTLQIYRRRWHVFQLQAGFLTSSKDALHEIARFVKLTTSPGLKLPPNKTSANADVVFAEGRVGERI